MSFLYNSFYTKVIYQMVPIFMEFNVGYITHEEPSKQWHLQMNRLMGPHTLLMHTQLEVILGKYSSSKSRQLDFW